MVSLMLKIFRDSLGVCGRRSKKASAFSDVENTGREPNGRITMRCVLVLGFWIVILALIVAGLMFGGPKLWTIFGEGVSVRVGR